jgi:hypothetical protein
MSLAEISKEKSSNLYFLKEKIIIQKKNDLWLTVLYQIKAAQIKAGFRRKWPNRSSKIFPN